VHVPNVFAGSVDHRGCGLRKILSFAAYDSRVASEHLIRWT
jgi:hypothetical protein